MKRFALLGFLVFAGYADAQIDFRLTPVASVRAVDIRHAGDNSGRLFFVSQQGQVKVLKQGQLLETPFIDVSSHISLGNERGLLSMAFSPNYANNGIFYLYYTGDFGASTIARYKVSDNPDIADADSGEEFLFVPQPFSNHNGGRLLFGSDGMLYLGIGDGGSAGDPQNNAQRPVNLLGTLIRIDVQSVTQGYAIPTDNPFVGQSGFREEIWAYGLRNPWRMSFDRATGDLYIADVGQNRIEEINFQAAGIGGQNYGWSVFEGSQCFRGGCDTPGFTPPIFEYDHSGGECSITGGEVYRGPDYPAMQGHYFYADFCTGRIWSLHRDGEQWLNQLHLNQAVGTISTFGEDERGNIYVAAASTVYLISDGQPVTTTVAIDGSLSGSYVVDGLNDQGFFVTVSHNDVGEPFLFITWFTFDENGAPLWLAGLSFFEPGVSSVELIMERIEGLTFLDFSDQRAEREEFGTMTFTAVDCDTFEAGYDFPAHGSGTLSVKRLTSIEGRGCSNAAIKREPSVTSPSPPSTRR